MCSPAMRCHEAPLFSMWPTTFPSPSLAALTPSPEHSRQQ